VWLIEKGHVHRAGYKSASLPAVGETILVRKMELDAEDSGRTAETEPVPARVTQVRGGTITATTDPAAKASMGP